MPRRTNFFQNLVTLVQQALVPTGAKVLASHMVPGLTPGRTREIDVYIETAIGPYSMRIAVEAKDESRKFDVTSMEEIVGKYRGRNNVSVDKVVVVTHRGFTLEAAALASAERIECMTLAEAEGQDWLGIITCPVHGPVARSITGPHTLKLKMDPHVEYVGFDPPIGSHEENRAATAEGRLLCRCHRTDVGSLVDVANAYLFGEVLRSPQIIGKLNEVASEGKGTAAVHLTRPIPNHVLRFREHDYPIASISVRIRYINSEAPFETKRYTMRDSSGTETSVQYGEAKTGGKVFEMLMPFGEQFQRGVLKLSDDEASDREPDYYMNADFKGAIWEWKDARWSKKQ